MGFCCVGESNKIHYLYTHSKCVSGFGSCVMSVCCLWFRIVLCRVLALFCETLVNERAGYKHQRKGKIIAMTFKNLTLWHRVKWRDWEAVLLWRLTCWWDGQTFSFWGWPSSKRGETQRFLSLVNRPSSMCFCVCSVWFSDKFRVEYRRKNRQKEKVFQGVSVCAFFSIVFILKKNETAAHGQK